MDKIIIEGRNKLSGSVRISGSKNAALPIIASTILTAKECVLTNVPRLNDVLVMNKLIKTVGGDTDFTGNTLYIRNKNITNFKAPYDLVKTMRASVLLALVVYILPVIPLQMLSVVETGRQTVVITVAAAAVQLVAAVQVASAILQAVLIAQQ